MNVTVFVERLGSDRFRAATFHPIPLETEAASREEALSPLRELAARRVGAGELVELDLPVGQESNPWIAHAGIWKDHPDFDEFLQNVAEYRRQVDAAEQP